jgi:hypothetical protein
VHEYVHYLQFTSSLPAANLIRELVSVAVQGALTVRGALAPEGGEVRGQHTVTGVLDQLPAGAGTRGVPTIRERIVDVRDELDALLKTRIRRYEGTCPPWSIDTSTLQLGQRRLEFWGLVAPDPSGNGDLMYAEFTPGALADTAARRVDRWVHVNHRCNEDAIADAAGSCTERFGYNGLYELLAQAPFSDAIAPPIREAAAVIICQLCLMTPKPDLAVFIILGWLAASRKPACTANAFAAACVELLQSTSLLEWSNYAQALSFPCADLPCAMVASERNAVCGHFSRMKQLVKDIAASPALLADPSATWCTIRGWMERYGVPQVILPHGVLLDSIAGVPCTEGLSYLLNQVRIAFPEEL